MKTWFYSFDNFKILSIYLSINLRCSIDILGNQPWYLVSIVPWHIYIDIIKDTINREPE